MHPDKRDLDELASIQANINKISRYRMKYGDDLSVFLNDEDYQDLCFYALVQIGEAVNALSDRFRSSHPEIAWADIYGMRCYLVHGYDNVDASIIWSAIVNDIPVLEALCTEQLP